MNEKEGYLYIILGCWGKSDKGFITCPSISNPILHIHKNLEDYQNLIKYLQSVQLFNKKSTDFNAVRNILFRIQNNFTQGYKSIWDGNIFRLMENFTIQHRLCGIYLSLEFIEEHPTYNTDKEIIINPTNNS